MDEATQARIFEPYFTTKTRGEGTGLGLATVHGIVTEMGGAIRVHSELGKGTTFAVLLPTAGDDGKITYDRSADAESLTGTERVLVVDDEEPIARFAKAALERLGYQVAVQTNPKEALDLFRQAPNAFDVVITDQMMPAITGTELSQQLLALRPDIPVILCSGFGDILQEVGGNNTGIRQYVMKPAIAADLAQAIRRTLDNEEAAET